MQVEYIKSDMLSAKVECHSDKSSRKHWLILVIAEDMLDHNVSFCKRLCENADTQPCNDDPESSIEMDPRYSLPT